MTDERFYQLLYSMFAKVPTTWPMTCNSSPQIERVLAIALRHVVERCGQAGEQALEEHCQAKADLSVDNPVT